MFIPVDFTQRNPEAVRRCVYPASSSCFAKKPPPSACLRASLCIVSLFVTLYHAASSLYVYSSLVRSAFGARFLSNLTFSLSLFLSPPFLSSYLTFFHAPLRIYIFVLIESTLPSLFFALPRTFFFFLIFFLN